MLRQRESKMAKYTSLTSTIRNVLTNKPAEGKIVDAIQADKADDSTPTPDPVVKASEVEDIEEPSIVPNQHGQARHRHIRAQIKTKIIDNP